ncbi:MAG TPA: NUDIX domain-containing protein [candidate division WOR-3 bacterium]|uniref:NUDIX domain-containing protein n=1 Tax=candidate division WOR-3 bacterium TaxID=2052148 RepID=A0A9C9JZQ5_UNCW3|nr:NUDIX domain-containing protein [candidate division WOR-3 bacterium]
MRAEFQVLIIPFVINENGKLEVAVFKRSGEKYWQFIAGGGKNNETVLEAAQREAYEEAGIIKDSKYFRLDAVAMIPKSCFPEHKNKTGLYVIPEYSFGVLMEDKSLRCSQEHSGYSWVSYEEAMNRLRYDSNKTALWELKERIEDRSIVIH